MAHYAGQKRQHAKNFLPSHDHAMIKPHGTDGDLPGSKNIETKFEYTLPIF